MHSSNIFFRDMRLSSRDHMNNWDMILVLILIGIGCGAGISVSIASGTASPLVLPLLTIFVHLSLHQAIGISLFIDCIIGLTAGMLFSLHGYIDRKKVLLIAIPGALGALLGSQLTTKASESGLQSIIGVILIILGANFLIFGIQKNITKMNQIFNVRFFQTRETIVLLVFGLLLGTISGFLGIGVGAIVALVMIFIFHMELHTAIGTSLIIMAIITGLGAIGHGFNEVVWHWSLIPLGCSAFFGSVIGSLFSYKIPENLLGRVIGVVIIVFGVVMLIHISG